MLGLLSVHFIKSAAFYPIIDHLWTCYNGEIMLDSFMHFLFLEKLFTISCITIMKHYQNTKYPHTSTKIKLIHFTYSHFSTIYLWYLKHGIWWWLSHHHSPYDIMNLLKKNHYLLAGHRTKPQLHFKGRMVCNVARYVT